MDEYYKAADTLPSWLAYPLSQLPTAVAERVHEIRLRTGCGLVLTLNGKQTPAAAIPEVPESLRELVLTQAQMDEVLFTLCGGSVHSHQEEIAQGYVRLPGGCRAGLGGTYLRHPDQGNLLQTVRSVNLRIARERMVPLPPDLLALLKEHFTGLLVVGEPDSGKTTLLRSIAAYFAARQEAVSVIDERGELFPEESSGFLKNKKTLPLDVISGLPKAEAVQMALRTLSPRVLLLDELGGIEEVSALQQGLFAGVDFIATLHAASLEEAARRPQVQALWNCGGLRAMVLLRGRFTPGRVQEVRVL